VQYSGSLFRKLRVTSLIIIGNPDHQAAGTPDLLTTLLHGTFSGRKRRARLPVMDCSGKGLNEQSWVLQIEQLCGVWQILTVKSLLVTKYYTGQDLLKRLRNFSGGKFLESLSGRFSSVIHQLFAAPSVDTVGWESSQRGQKDVRTCSSGERQYLLMRAAKPTADWISPLSKPKRVNVTVTPCRPVNLCYMTLLCCGRMRKSVLHCLSC
jgi:hypothetical protein